MYGTLPSGRKVYYYVGETTGTTSFFLYGEDAVRIQRTSLIPTKGGFRFRDSYWENTPSDKLDPEFRAFALAVMNLSLD